MTPAEGPGAALGAPGAVSGLLAALDSAGVEWSLLRPVASLAEPEGDIDVLVAPEGVPTVERMLAERGFALVPIDGPDVHAALYDREADRFAWMHVQPELRLAGAALPARELLAEAVEEEGVRRPSDAWLLWILLLRALVDKGELAARHRPAVAELAADWDGGPAALERLAARRGVDPAAAVADAAAEDWQGLMARSVHRPPGPPPSLARRLARLPFRLGAMRRRWGMSVAVIGPDGAGKTSLAKALAEDLPLPTRVQYMGLTGGQLPRADALRLPGLVFCARIAIIWMRYGRGIVQRARGGIVIFERYTLDAVAPSGMRLSPVARFSRQVQGRSVPMPDLVLLLDASGETLFRRSEEYDADVLEGWRRAFAKLPARVDHVVKLDAERPPDDVRREAEQLVWRRYTELRGRRPGER